MQFALVYAYNPAVAGPAGAEVAEWLAFDQQVRDAGAFVYEAGLHPAVAASTISVRDGQASIERGARAGDAIAGLYVVDVANEDEALAWAQRIPTATYGHVEVRQVVEF